MYETKKLKKILASILEYQMSKDELDTIDLLKSLYPVKEKMIMYFDRNNDISNSFYSMIDGVHCIFIKKDHIDKDFMYTIVHEYAHALATELFPKVIIGHSKQFFVIWHCLTIKGDNMGVYHDPCKDIFKRDTIASFDYIDKVLTQLPSEFSELVEQSRNTKRVKQKWK